MRGTLIGVPRVRHRAKIPAPAGQWGGGQRKYRYRVTALENYTTQLHCFYIPKKSKILFFEIFVKKTNWIKSHCRVRGTTHPSEADKVSRERERLMMNALIPCIACNVEPRAPVCLVGCSWRSIEPRNGNTESWQFRF